MIPSVTLPIEFTPALAESVKDLQAKLEKYGQGMEITGEYLAQVADDVFATEAEESFERAAEVPFKQSTVERKARAGKRWNEKGRRDRRVVTSKHPPLAPVLGPEGIFTALTSRPWDQAVSRPVALRELVSNGFIFGTKRWVSKYASFHQTGTSRGLPARLDWLTGESLQAAEEKLLDVNAQHIYVAMERAGFTHKEIAAFFDSDPQLEGRY